jgi:amino acid adenylation domain-containing protein/non-ribosomal peptide synthase protein (TIGR01720 family)
MNKRSLDPAALAAAKRALLAHLLEEKGLKLPKSPLIGRRVGAAPPPLAFAQQRLWFLDQLAPGTAVYNNPTAVRLIGPLDSAALERGLNAVVGRHESLRTTFATLNGQPVQVIAPELTLSLQINDLQHIALNQREAAAQHLADAEARRPFDLANGPLLRATLLRMAPEEAILVLSLHHIVSDGWSMGVLLRDVMSCYNAELGGALTLPELPIQYADYAIWQREWLQGAAGVDQQSPLQEQLSYWRRQLAELPVLTLPTDHPRASIETFQGLTSAVALPPALARELNALSQREGVTLFMTLLATFQILLGRYSRQTDIVVGSPIANRTRPEIKDLIGVFVNMLVLRTSLSGNPSFLALLQQVRALTLDAYAHQDLPFERLVDELQPARNLNHTPLFQVVLALQNTPMPDVRLTSLTMLPVEIHTGTTKFDLTLNLSDSRAGITGVLEYNRTLFDATTIARLLAHFQALLAGVVTDPGYAIANLPLLTPHERHQLIADWNDTRTGYTNDRCIHELFEDQAAQRPDALAAVFDGSGGSIEHLTYRELNERANQLAQLLRRLGVGPEVPVAICMERSTELVIGLQGVLKAGGFYVPIEPAWPGDRIEWILASLRVRCLLTLSAQQPALRAIQRSLPQLTDIICLDDAATMPDDARPSWTRRELRALPQHDLPRTTTLAAPEQIAYIIYTSGSTGVPKGVVVRHQPVVNLIEWVNQTYAIGPADWMLCVASLCFDLSVYDILGLLAAGGVVQIARESDVEDPERLLQMLCSAPVTFWDSAPAALQQLVAFFPTARARGGRNNLRLVFLSGDWIPVTLPDAVRSAFPRAQVIGLGGGTEATIWSNYYAINDVAGRSSIPYGRPIQNARYHILDPHLHPCPIGVPGDLYIGDECLADGYMNDAAQTAERFVPDPFVDCRLQIADCRSGRSTIDNRQAAIGYRLYRTGDQARFWPDGNIEFLGRVDHQVKIRGFRIELGEIQVVLARHPAVRACVVLDREDIAGSKRLVAYVVPTKDEGRTTKEEESDPSVVRRPSSVVPELRVFLQAKLPAYMVPAAFVLIDDIPLTPNGKVDRRALPAPASVRAEQDALFVPPRSAAELTLAAIWGELLGLDRVGIRDNFFALGGDSILSLQVVTRANQAGLHITPRQMFLHQTISELAAAVDGSPAPAVEQGPVTGPVPLTPIQCWFFAQELVDPQHWNQAVLLELQPIAPALLMRAARGLLAHHDALRLRFTRAEAGWRQHIAPPADELPLVWLDLSALTVAAQVPLIERTAAQAQAGMHLDGGLIQLIVYDCGDAANRLLIVAHHLLIDGVSWRIVLEDLQTLCRASGDDALLDLPRKTTSFKLWAERLVAYAQAETVQAELGYWLALPWHTTQALPIDLADGDNSAATARSVTVTIDAAATRALLQSVPAAYRTQIDDVLLTALALAFARWTGTPTLLLDLERHGREPIFEDVDLTRTVGWLTTIAPALIDVDTQAEPGTQLMAVKERLRALPQRGIGYGLLRYLAADPASAAQLRALPQPEVSFNYLGQFAQALPANAAFQIARESSGPAHSPRGHRTHLLEITALVARDQLQLDWVYSVARHRQATIARLAQDFLDALRLLIAHCQSPEAGGYTPSDFPLAGLDQQKLGQVLSQLDDDTAEDERR